MNSLIIALILSVLSPAVLAKITTHNHRYYVQVKNRMAPIHLLNTLIENREVSAIKIYANGNIHMISFAKKDGVEKVYSIDEKGYMYAIEPFSHYQVSRIDKKNMIQFAQVPHKKFFINSDGFFIYK